MNPHTLPLPCDTQIEEEILGTLLVASDNDIIEILESLEPEDFFHRSSRIVFLAIQDLHKSNKSFDLLSVTSHLKDLGRLEEVGGNYYVSKLTLSHVVGFKAMDGVQILKEKTRLRKLLEIAEDLRTAAYSNQNSQVVVTNFEMRMSSVLDKNTTKDLTTSGVELVVEMVDKRIKGEKIYGIETGIKSFDDIFFGLQPAQYYAIAGRPSAGKTAFADQCCIQFIKNQIPVLYIPLESDEGRVIGKIACKMAKISYERFIKNKCNESELKAIRACAQTIRHSNLIVRRPSHNTPDALRALLVREIRKHECKIFIIDYVQKILDEKGDPRIGTMLASMTIQDVCVNLKTSGIVVCQMNRDAEKEKRPRMGHLKESGQIEQDADNICLLWSEKEKHELNPGEMLPSIMTIEKNKDGISGVDQKLSFDRELMTFKERNIFK